MKRSDGFLAAMSAYDDGDAALALKLMEQCAESGDPVACYTAALWRKHGESGATDLVRCAFWLNRLEDLAQGGDAMAQYELSGMYRWGDLLEQEVRLANHWLERSAENGHGEAQHHLAWYHETGQYGYSVDRAVAASWYRRAFEQGHPETLYLFAMQEMEDGEPTETALALLQRAARNGLKQAEHVLRSITH